MLYIVLAKMISEINIPTPPLFNIYQFFSYLSFFAYCITGRLPSAEAAGNSRLFQHAAAQLQCRREGPQKAGEWSTTENYSNN